MKIKPIVFANGDETTGLVANLVREMLFNHIPTVDVDLSVKARLETKDACIQNAAEAFQLHGAGVKISTASDDERIKSLKMGSVNIKLRPLTRAFAMLRATKGPGNYVKPVAVLRYAYGGFYDEVSCEIDQSSDSSIARVTSVMNLDAMEDYAKLIYDIQQKYDYPVIISSKWTIAESEALFHKVMTSWLSHYKAQYSCELTDVAIARIATDRKGGWIRAFDNVNGDTAADVADFVHGNHVMSSTVYCSDGKNGFFSYEELPGGTAPDLMDKELSGKHFFNPLITVFAFSNAIMSINPDLSEYCKKIREVSLIYLDETNEGKRDTNDMLKFIAKKVKK